MASVGRPAYGAWVLFEQVARTSAEVARTSARKQKTARIAELLREAPVAERAICARYLSGETGYKLGIGHATVGELGRAVLPAAVATLTATEVDRRFAAIASLRGTGAGRNTSRCPVGHRRASCARRRGGYDASTALAEATAAGWAAANSHGMSATPRSAAMMAA